MKIDPLCNRCAKSCKQQFPAIVVFCAKYIPLAFREQKDARLNRLPSLNNAKRGWTKV